MNKSYPNDLLVYNINFEKGAFAVNLWGEVYAFIDYTSYIIDTSKIVPEFLFCSLRCKSFMDYVASVKPKRMKTRARYDFIKDFEIPVPSIPEQQEILKAYHTTPVEADDNFAKSNSFSDGLLLDIQSEVSDLKKHEKDNRSGISIIEKVPFSAVSITMESGLYTT